jgi:uncharacterized damage-inducible protein DinB
MDTENICFDLKEARQTFERTTSCFREEHSTFVPKEGMYTVAQQVAHTAQTVEWFVHGAFSASGFDLNFQKHHESIAPVNSLAQAMVWLARAFEQAQETFGHASAEELCAPLPEGPIMGGAARCKVVAAIVEHTAHHRGSLAVYARLAGLEPPMPYGA